MSCEMRLACWLQQAVPKPSARMAEKTGAGEGARTLDAESAIKLAGVTTHTLRHTLGSTAVSFGESLKMTGAMLGHATATATEVYAHMQQPSKDTADRVSYQRPETVTH